MSLLNKTEKMTTRSNSTSSLISFTDEKASKRARDDISQDAACNEISSFDELWKKIDRALTESNQRIETKIESCMAKINEVEVKLAALSDECTSKVKTMSVVVNEVRGELGATNESVCRLEKSSDLIVSGIPFATNENLKNIFERIARTLGYTETPLVYPKRMARGPIKAGETPAIICQFALRIERDTFYRKYMEQRSLNLSHIGFQSGNRIYINENLTLLARSVRTEALKLKRLGKLHQVFTNGGVVHVKTSSTAAAVPCHSVLQLDNL